MIMNAEYTQTPGGGWSLVKIQNLGLIPKLLIIISEALKKKEEINKMKP